MLFEGKSLTVADVQDGIYEMRFDLNDSSVNKFNQATIKELGEAVTALQRQKGVKGLLLCSAKKSFFVGADIGEFGALFQSPEADIIEALLEIDALFSSIEDLPFPTVVAINGEALGGGLEVVRLPRMIGVDNAIEWIATGSNKRAPQALKDGAVDAVVAEDMLRDASLQLLQDCIDDKFDYLARREEKKAPLPLSTIERTMAFEAFKVEAAAFAKLTKSPVTASLIGIFMKDQFLKKQSKSLSEAAREVSKTAVLGAGIMGGGIAYQSASNGVPILMKDINQQALDDGLAESDKLVFNQVKRGKFDQAAAAAAMHRIMPTLRQ